MRPLRRLILLLIAGSAALADDPIPPPAAPDPGRTTLLNLCVEDMPVSAVFAEIEKQLGRPVVWRSGPSALGTKLLAEKISLHMNGATVWQAAEEIDRLSGVRFQGVGARTVVFAEELKQPDQSIFFRPTVEGAFLLTPILRAPMKNRPNLLIRPEPWIGKPRLVGCRATWIFQKGRPFPFEPKRDDAGYLPQGEDELEIPLARDGSNPLRTAKAIDFEAELMIPLAWETKILPPVGGLIGKKLAVGKLQVEVLEAKWDKKDFRLKARVSNFAIPRTSLTLLDAGDRRLEHGDTGANYRLPHEVEFSFSFRPAEVRGDPLTYRLVLDAPMREAPHKLKATIVVAELKAHPPL